MLTNGAGRKPTRARPRADRLTIGLLIPMMNQLDVLTRNPIWAGAVDAAQGQDINLICYMNDFQWFSGQTNVIYELASADLLDGLIVASGELGFYVSMEELVNFCRRNPALATVSLSIPLPGIPSVVVDDAKGMEDALEHLIADHGYRRLALISGPESHPEVQSRYQAYLDVLAAHRLPFDKQLVAPSRYDRKDGEKAIRLLLDERQVDFEAVVTLDDKVALGAIDALQARGIRVPYDVAVVGFDDLVEQTRPFHPPLTTVRYPFYELGRRGVETMVGLLSGQDIPDRVPVATRLIIRQSCGCIESQILQAVAPIRGTTQPFEVAFAAQQAIIRDEISQLSFGSTGGDRAAQVDQLLDAFVAEISGQEQNVFLSALEQVLRQAIRTSSNMHVWQDALSVLRRHTLPLLEERNSLIQAETLWHQARLIVSRTEQQIKAYDRIVVEGEIEAARRAGETLATTFDVFKLMDTLVEELPKIGINRCFVALYEKWLGPFEFAPSGSEITETGSEEKWCRLMLAYHKEASPSSDRYNGLPPDARRFPAGQLVPDDLLHVQSRYMMLVEPLFFGREEIGYILFQLGPQHGVVYNLLRGQISSALKGSSLIQQVQIYIHNLETANIELKEAQEQIMRQEKLAVLGQLAGIIGHELRNPLAIIANAAYYLQTILINTGDIVDEYLEIISNQVRESNRFVADLLHLSHTRANTKERVLISDIVSEVLQQHPPPHEIRLIRRQPRNPCMVYVDPMQIKHVLTNLVTNAYQAMSGGGTLTICIHNTASEVQVSVSDTGGGISPEIQSKMFEPLFTTKTDGIGLGLVISKSLVALNGGRIEVTSAPGQGSTFTLALPLILTNP